MGVDVTVLDFLMKFRGKIGGDTLHLGRQGLHISPDRAHQQIDAAEAILQRYDPAACFADIADSSGYSDKLFRYLGSSSVVSLDASAYEGATIVHDLNLPVGEGLIRRFDTIFDGGTIEHVFNVPTALQNVKTMLRVGGLFLSVNAANNQLGHGFYQFSPELMWRVFSNGSGFEVELMQTVVLSHAPAPVDAPDPESLGRRVEIGFTPGATYLLVVARKIAEVDAAGAAYQSDYAGHWKRAAAQ
jgi:hypothetical protein